MKTLIEFNLPEEREELDAALSGSRNKMLIETLYSEVFRPHFKYDKPIIGKEITLEQFEILEVLWKNIAEHFEID
jgi:hypothetical protein